MSIGTAVQKDRCVVVYDERGRQISAIFLGVEDAALQGYTSQTVSVRRGNYVVTYDERGGQMAMVQLSVRR